MRMRTPLAWTEWDVLRMAVNLLHEQAELKALLYKNTHRPGYTTGLESESILFLSVLYDITARSLTH